MSPALQAQAGLDEEGHTDLLTCPSARSPPLSAILDLWPSPTPGPSSSPSRLFQERRALERKAAELEEELKVIANGKLRAERGWAVGAACPGPPG